MKKKAKVIKKAISMGALCMVLYVFIMLVCSAIVLDNPELMCPGQVSAQINNPFDEDDKNLTKRFEQFEAFVIVASATETESHDLHLMALPGQRAQIYRNFTIYIFSNMPCYYEVRKDDQLLERGTCEWKAKIMGSSAYNKMDIEVKLINETDVELPVFYFNDLTLLDSPWEAVGEGEGPPVVEEWIRMSRGDFTMWVIRNIIMQIMFGFFGAVGGVSLATIHADLRGIERAI